MDHLFSPYKLGRIQLKNRVVMSPMTRCRCIGNQPNEMVAKYYAQRAEAGLIVTEGTSPSANGLGYARIPGLYTTAQMNAWKLVTDAVHKAGSKIFVQLMHCGRVCHPLNMPSGMEIMAPSAVALTGETMWTDQEGMQPYPVPQEMTESDIQNTLTEYAHSAELAIQAGFDGVEIHGANGYLVDQFLNTATNLRHGNWGGSVAGRARFAVEVMKKVSSKIGPDRVGIRVSPYGTFNGMIADNHVEDLYERLADEFQKMGCLYIHIVDHSAMGAPEVKPRVKEVIRSHFRGTVILSGDYTVKKANADIANKKGDLFAFGKPFIANPNLVTKLRSNQPLLPADPQTFYTADEKGYLI